MQKRVAAQVRREQVALDALAREASFLARAVHPALPRLFVTGADDDGPFVVEEAVLGRTLEQLTTSEPNVLTPRVVAIIVRDAARALVAIHELGDAVGPLELVHGDLSFGNIVASRDGSVRFVDFGDATHRGAPRRGREPSAGTPPYAAPEILRGDALPTRATDVYALGAVATALVTGAPLRPERDSAVRLVRLAEQGIDRSVLAKASIGRRLAEALDGLVAFDPRDRETSLGPLLDALP